MDDLRNFFSQADNFILWANAIFFSAFLFVQSSFYLLKDIKAIKGKAIVQIYENLKNKNENIEVVDLIDQLYNESKVLVLPAERNDNHFKLSMTLYFVVGVVTIFNKPLGSLISVEETTFYIIYLPFLGYGISFLIYKFILFRNYYKLQKKFYEKKENINHISINSS